MNERKQKRQIWTTVCTNKHTVDAKPTDNLVSVLVFTLFFLHRISNAKLLLKNRPKDEPWGGERSIRDFLK